MEALSQFIEMFEEHNFNEVKLKNLIDKTFPGEWGKEDIDGSGTKVIRTTNFTNEGSLNLTDVVTRNIETKKVEKKKLLKGDIILERSGGTQDNPVGRVVCFDADGLFVTNNFTQTLRCSSDINSLYLFYFLFIFYKRNKMIIRGMGSQTTGIQNLSMSQYQDLKIIVPPIELQLKFASIAQQADKSKFGGFKSQFIEMFGNCSEQAMLSTQCDTFIDGDWIESKDQSEEGIRLIQTGNIGLGFFKDKDDKSRYISEDTFKKLNCTEIMHGDILVSRLPDPIGRACVIPEGIGKAITAVDCTIIRLKEILLPEYFISFTMTALYTGQINKLKTGTTRLRVSRGNLGKIMIPIPPIELQQKFAGISQQADKSKVHYQKIVA